MRIFKKITFILDIILVIILLFIGFIQISIIISKQQHFGVPSLFGKSVLYVSTDSMLDPDNPESLSPGTGIIIESISPKDLKPSTPIYNEEGLLIDYEKDGDIVTFYCPNEKTTNTHRVVEKNYIESEGKYYFITMGDNPILHHSYLAEMWSEDFLVGKVVGYSRSLGSFLEIASPEAAAFLTYRTGVFHVAWFFPVAVLIPFLTIAISHIVEYFVSDKSKNEIKNEK